MAAPALPWDIFEEHLSEAAFLWEQWEVALDSAVETLADVAVGPEQRLLAHLDALVLGGKPVASRLLLPALEGEPEVVRPAAWALLAAEDADHLDGVLAALAAAEPPQMQALGRALALAPHAAIPTRLSGLWKFAEPPLRALLMSVMETRDPAWAALQLPQTLAATEPALLVPSLRLLRRSWAGDAAALRHLEHALAWPDPAVRAEAMATSVALGQRTPWDFIRREVTEPGVSRQTMGLLALSTVPSDKTLLYERVRDPATRRTALWALAFAADVEAADQAIQWIGDEELGPLAGEVLSAITGLVIDGVFRAPGKTQGPDVEEVGPDDPPPEVRPEDHLPRPHAPAVTAWWRDQRGRYKPGQRYLGGQLRTPEALRGALATAATWRRDVLAIELAAVTRAPVTVDLRHFSQEQVRHLEAPAPRVARAGR